MGTVVKNSPANTGDTGDMGSISGLGRSLEGEMATHSSVLAWRIPGTREPNGLPSAGVQLQQPGNQPEGVSGVGG